MTKRLIKADRPTSKDGRAYHLHTRLGSLSELCLLVGSPERATMIAKNFFDNPKLVGNYRGFKCYTGFHLGIRMSVVTCGMGGPSIGIVLREAVESGARIFIRVGSCGTLQPEPNVGDSVICTGAVRLDGATKNWAPIEYPAIADYRIVAALVQSAKELDLPYHVGIGATTDCFREGQARPDVDGYIPPRLQAQHEELTHCGVLFYAMEEAALFVWCSTHGNLRAGVIDAIYANRVTGDFKVTGDEQAAKIAIHAMCLIAQGKF